LSGGNFSQGFTSGLMVSGLNHAMHSVFQELQKPNWNKLTNSDKIKYVLDAMRQAKIDDIGYADFRKIFKNFPKHQTSVGKKGIMGDVNLEGNLVTIDMDVANYKDMRFSLNGKNNQVGPNLPSKPGYWSQITYGAYRGHYIRYPLPIMSLQIKASNYSILYRYLNPN
jgi:hypothetical protein